jgi:hypothetical protein
MVETLLEVANRLGWHADQSWPDETADTAKPVAGSALAKSRTLARTRWRAR